MHIGCQDAKRVTGSSDPQVGGGVGATRLCGTQSQSIMPFLTPVFSKDPSDKRYCELPVEDGIDRPTEASFFDASKTGSKVGLLRGSWVTGVVKNDPSWRSSDNG